MNGLFEWVFGLDALSLGDEGVRFEMTRSLAAWIWAPLLAGAVVLAGVSYWRLRGPVRARVALGCVRALLLVILLLLAAGPRLIRDNERVERDTVAVLVDRSASLTMPDGGEGLTRDAQVRALLGHGVWEALAERHDVRFLGFDTSAYELDPSAPGDADGARTRLGSGLRTAFDRLGGRPVSGLVVLTDGRTSEPPSARLVRALGAERIGVYPVPLGAESELLDLALHSVDVPSSAFVGDYIPLSATVVSRGVETSGGAARVVLLDSATGLELDSTTIAPEDWVNGSAEVRLATRPELAGDVRWAIRVEPVGPDLLADNNERQVDIELIDRPIRLAYFDGYPRWDYRYVKDLLVREASVESSIMLLATDRRYIQEGNVGLPVLPRSSGEWGAFDVIVLGDLRPDVFSVEQLEQIRDQVALRGAGLIWMAGPGSTPWRWGDTPLADLLPFATTTPDGARPYRAASSPVVMVREPGAERLGVLEMGAGADAGWPEVLSDPSLNWPVLRWSLDIDPASVKATAQTLASTVPIDAGADGVGSPNVLTMRYGAGRVVFVGIDEVWRWRYARGETLAERFYLPLIRLAGRGSIARSGRSVVLEASPGVISQGEPVSLRATLLDQSLVDAAPPAVRVRITRDASSGAEAVPPVVVTLGADTVGGGGQSLAAYASSWFGAEPGEYTVEPADPVLATSGARARFRVVAPDDELRVPEADHALLAGLAVATDGAVVRPDEIGSLAELLPDRSVVVVGEPEVETLWDKPIVLVVLVLLLTFEWVGRRLVKLA